jgi:hypothetical protein
MKDTVLLAEEVMDDPQVLRDWFRRSFDFALTLPKKAKASAAKASAAKPPAAKASAAKRPAAAKASAAKTPAAKPPAKRKR